MSDSLIIAGQNNDPEIFYTLEGEGAYVGYPSVFMRLSMCNLTCKGFASVDSPNGCDSYCSWSVKNKLTFDQLAELYEKSGFKDLLMGGALWKITGGEPLLQQRALIDWFRFTKQRWGKSFTPHIDFETNGTIIPLDEIADIVPGTTYTVSPKLSSNGDSENIRFKVDALNWHVMNNSAFKFVIQNEDDVREVFDKYINNPEVVPEDIKNWFHRNRVWFMVCAGSQKEFLENSVNVAELAKKYVVKFSSRLHLQLWNKAVRA